MKQVLFEQVAYEWRHLFDTQYSNKTLQILAEIKDVSCSEQRAGDEINELINV